MYEIQFENVEASETYFLLCAFGEEEGLGGGSDIIYDFVVGIVCECHRIGLPDIFPSRSHREKNRSEKMNRTQSQAKKRRSQEKHIYEVQMILKSVCDNVSPRLAYIYTSNLRQKLFGADTTKFHNLH